jgi:hypothetical protein
MAAGFAAQVASNNNAREAAMTTHDDRVHRITDRAYEFARSGAFENMASLERKLAQEGYAGDMDWLEEPGVRRTLAEISTASRELQIRAERQSI